MTRLGDGRVVAGTRRQAAELRRELEIERERRIAAEQTSRRQRFAWAKYLGSTVTTLTALGALLFTGLALQQSRAQNYVAEQGQITDRYTAAIGQLGSQSEDVRLGGIYALERIMHDSPSDQPTIVEVLSAFIRNHPPGSTNPTVTRRYPIPLPPTDIAAALTVLAQRDKAFDNGSRVDLEEVNLADLYLDSVGPPDIHSKWFTGAYLTDANLTGADLNGDLSGTFLDGVNLSGADLQSADLSGADLETANMMGALLDSANLSSARMDQVNLTDADLTGANLSNAQLSYAILVGTNLTNANLAGAYFNGTSMCNGTTPTHAGGYLCSTG